jgi:nitrate/nitrite-specific signal transduction histidine kinase
LISPRSPLPELTDFEDLGFIDPKLLDFDWIDFFPFILQKNAEERRKKSETVPSIMFRDVMITIFVFSYFRKRLVLKPLKRLKARSFQMKLWKIFLEVS